MPATTDARPEGPGSGHRRFDPDTSSIAETRRYARAMASAYVVDDQRLGDIELATSELVTNAIEHGVAAPVVVGVDGSPDEVVVSVTSSVDDVAPPTLVGTAVDSAAIPGQPELLLNRGRGLAIARAVSDEIEIVSGGATLTVVCRFRVGESGA